MSPRPAASPIEVAEQTAVSDVVVDIFRGMTAADLEQKFDKLFKQKAAKDLLSRVGNPAKLLSPEDSYEDALRKLDEEIAKLERVRDELFDALFEEIRPLEQSYRLLHLFFANTEVAAAKMQDPVEFYVFNADATAIEEPTESPTIEAIKKWVQERNDSFDFRKAISNLVVPGYVEESVRKALEVEADRWGMLLIGDLANHKDFEDLSRQFNPNDGKYKFLKRQQDQASSDVILSNWLKLRDRHWFETDRTISDGVYGPSSLVFAGAMVRSDRTAGAGISQGPVGMRHGRISGAERARFEPLISQTEQLTMDRQLITVIRNADNDLCFMGARNQADDPRGTQKFFTTYRVFRFIERMVANYVRQVAYETITRKVVDERIIEPLQDFFTDLKKAGIIQDFDPTFGHDYNEDDYAQGIVRLNFTLKPVGPAETFEINIAEMKGGGE